MSNAIFKKFNEHFVETLSFFLTLLQQPLAFCLDDDDDDTHPIAGALPQECLTSLGVIRLNYN